MRILMQKKKNLTSTITESVGTFFSLFLVSIGSVKFPFKNVGPTLLSHNSPHTLLS